MFKFKKVSGQVSRLLLVLAAVVLVAVVIVYLVMKMANPAPKPPVITTPVIPMPVYEQKLGDFRFLFQSAIDKGSVLRATDARNYTDSKKDLPISNAGAKFIQVTVAAQNVGTENTSQNLWDIENVVDSQGRNFIPFTGSGVNSWLPYPDQCGDILKPVFDPTPCTKIYEVPKSSTGFKVRVLVNRSASSKKGELLLDLIVK